MQQTSLTNLGNINGYSDNNNNILTAEFNEIKSLTPYYERTIHYVDQKPWGKRYMDTTYMNHSKLMNEEPVVTYKELELKPIPYGNYQFVEGFGENSQNFYAKLLSFMFVMFMIYYLVVE